MANPPLSAADLQKRHDLEGAPDPFPPSLIATPLATSSSSTANEVLDTESHTAFPSLGAPASNGAPKPSWGAGPRIKPSVVKIAFVSDSFTLSSMDLTSSGKDGKPVTLGDIMKQVMAKYKVKLEASANQKSRQTTFHIKAESQRELDKAKRSLLALLSPIVTRILHAPASTIAIIIGPKGATLKQIRDQTGVKVDIPPKDSLGTPGGPDGQPSDQASPVQEDEEPSVPITLNGPEPLVYEAQALLNQIISQKTSKTTQRVRDIPEHVLPFVIARKATFDAAAEGADVHMQLHQLGREITVSGDREAVTRVVESIKATVEGLKTNLSHIKYPLPKRQHRLLLGKSADEIMNQSKCAVVVPKADDPAEEVVIWGAPADLGNGVGAVITQANSQYIGEVPIPGSFDTAKRLLTYLARIHYTKSIATDHPDVTIHLPAQAMPESSRRLTLDVVGPQAAVEKAVEMVEPFFASLSDATAVVPVDWLVHRALQGKNAKKWKQLYDSHNVHVYFPNEAAEDSHVFLIFDVLSPSASTSSAYKKKCLDEAAQEVCKLAKEVADVKSQMITVEKKWHDVVAGPGRTTLNAIIGEEKALSIKIGSEAGEPDEDVIKVRGISVDVDLAIKKIREIVENAKNDEIINSYSTEFDIDREYVGRIVGTHGAGINKLREQLGVKVDVSDEPDAQEKEGSKKKKATHAHQKSKVKITGRKENVEEAQKRILGHVERMADETSEILKIPAQYHPSLIGQNGKYAIRLEENYSVKITFPRSNPENAEGKTREQLKPDEVLVKGGRKGVAGAKKELLDALEFEIASNEVIKFNVPNRSVARILGRGGATINEIKDNTGAAIDVVKGSDTNSMTQITLRGTKTAINEAKAAILTISNSVVDEITESITIENKYHRTIIGVGGKGLKELFARCGGPSDQRAQAGLIRFPRPGEPSDDVVLRGEPQLVQKLKAELEKVAAEVRDRVVLGVDIPASQHRALIGRGGQHLNDLESRTGTQVQFPGSRSYGQVGEPENVEELKDADPANIIKISGPRAACQKTIDILKSQIKPPTADAITDSVVVPLKFHHAISQQGQLFRTLRSFGVQVEQSAHPQKSAVPTRPADIEVPMARIDDLEEVEASAQWQVIPNYQDAEEGDSTWTLKARDQAGLDQAHKSISEAIAQAARMSHVGFLTLPDRSSFPKIVGTKGSNVSRLRIETGADITVSRDTNTIVIIGSSADILAAKDAILRMVANPGRGHRRNRD